MASPQFDYQKQIVDSDGNILGTAANPLVTSVGTAAASLGKVEDAAHASGDTGVMLLAVRKDTAAALAGTDGDYIPVIVDSSGRLHIAALVAGENYIGSVGGTTRLATGTMTRPSDTTQYAAGDGITTATSSASAMSVTNAARVSAGSGIIFGGVLEKSATSATAASFRGWIYQDAPSAVPNDNAAFTAAVHADYQKLVGTFTCDLSSVGVAGSDGLRGPITLERTNMAFKLASGTSLTVILEARGTYTPASAEVFRLALDIAQD